MDKLIDSEKNTAVSKMLLALDAYRDLAAVGRDLGLEEPIPQGKLGYLMACEIRRLGPLSCLSFDELFSIARACCLTIEKNVPKE